MKNYKDYWDNFNTTHYLNLLTERKMREFHKDYIVKKDEEKQMKKDIHDQINLVFFGLGMVFFIYYFFAALGVIV